MFVEYTFDLPKKSNKKYLLFFMIENSDQNVDFLNEISYLNLNHN
jgi:hypothetical protein